MSDTTAAQDLRTPARDPNQQGADPPVQALEKKRRTISLTAGLAVQQPGSTPATHGASGLSLTSTTPLSDLPTSEPTASAPHSNTDECETCRKQRFPILENSYTCAEILRSVDVTTNFRLSKYCNACNRPILGHKKFINGSCPYANQVNDHMQSLLEYRIWEAPEYKVWELQYMGTSLYCDALLTRLAVSNYYDSASFSFSPRGTHNVPQKVKG